MKMDIREYMTIQTQHALTVEAGDVIDAPEVKAMTVRVPPCFVNLLDELAEHTNQTRQALAAYLMTSAIDEALRGYADAFSDPSDVYKTMRERAGFNNLP
jgi:predicted DNA-binding protein